MKKVALLFLVFLLVVAGLAVAYETSKSPDRVHHEYKDEFRTVEGMVRGYTEQDGYLYVNINAMSYKIRGLSESDLKEIIGEQVVFKLLKHKDYYEYIGVEDPIIEQIITTNLTEQEIKDIDFCDWLEQKHPIMNKILWKRYHRVR